MLAPAPFLLHSALPSLLHADPTLPDVVRSTADIAGLLDFLLESFRSLLPEEGVLDMIRCSLGDQDRFWA